MQKFEPPTSTANPAILAHPEFCFYLVIVCYKKATVRILNFLHIFAIPSSSRHENYCHKFEIFFVVFLHSFKHTVYRENRTPMDEALAAISHIQPTLSSEQLELTNNVKWGTIIPLIGKEFLVNLKRKPSASMNCL